MTTLPIPAKRKLGMHWSLGACVFLAIAAFFLWEEHRAHLLGALPYLLFLACPLMHFFMHRGHQHGDDSGSKSHEPSHEREPSHEHGGRS